MKQINYAAALAVMILFPALVIAQAVSVTANWGSAPGNGFDGWTQVTPAGFASTTSIHFSPASDEFFGFDDDDAGVFSDGDAISIESPIIDLTPAAVANETDLTIAFPLAYNDAGSGANNLFDYFGVDYFDADAGEWVETITVTDDVGNTASGDSFYLTAANQANVNFTISICDFTPTQLSGFRIRFVYDDGLRDYGSFAWNWGFSIGEPSITSATPAANDVAVVDQTPLGNRPILEAATSYDVEVSVQNFGSASLSNVDVFYRLNGGTAVGPVSIPSLSQCQTATVTFTGANALNEAASSPLFEAYTNLTGDVNTANDTSFGTVFIQSPVSTFPYFEDMSGLTDWIVSEFFEDVGTEWGREYLFRWTIVDGTNFAGIVDPNGVVDGPSATAPYFVTEASTAYLLSPMFDFSGLTNPQLVFQMTHRSGTMVEDDALQVRVSTDGGESYQPASYSSSFSQTPSLSTLAPNTTAYNPASSDEWRHVIVDLSAFAGNSSVVVAFEGTSDAGNYLHIDNFMIVDAVNASRTTITGGGPVSLDDLTIDFNTIGSANGILNLVRINGDPPYQGSGSILTPTTTELAASGSVLPLDLVPPDGHYIVAYTGEDYNASIDYDVSLDLTSYGLLQPIESYLVRREDAWGSWTAGNTSLVGSELQRTGLSSFSEYTVGGPFPTFLPVDLLRFEGSQMGRTNVIKWTTETETGNLGFELEKMNPSGAFMSIGFVPSEKQNSNQATDYQFVDYQPFSGQNVYRLVQKDIDGRLNFSEHLEVNFTPDGSLFLYPNPAKDQIFVDIQQNTGRASLSMWDVQGRLVWEKQWTIESSGTIAFPIDIQAGMYSYRLQTGQETLSGRLIVK
ncbi:MAG: T9SS type A sorting domain-containing protein [Bacteroidota bacterium]